jgi:hypothetical protein
MKLDLLANAIVVDDAIRFISNHNNTKFITSFQNNNEVKKSRITTITNQIF